MVVSKGGAQRSKSEKNAERRHRKNLREGIIPPGTTKLECQAFDRRKRANACFTRAERLDVPEDVSIETLIAYHVPIYEYLETGTATVNKKYDLFTNRAIWFNAVDPSHSFYRKHRDCRANHSLVSFHIEAGTVAQVPELLILYYNACQEAGGTGQQQRAKFVKRERFLNAWQYSEDDIAHFTSADRKRWNNFSKDLLEALAPPPSAPTAPTAHDHGLTDDNNNSSTNEKGLTTENQQTFADQTEQHPTAVDDAPYAIDEGVSTYDEDLATDDEDDDSEPEESLFIPDSNPNPMKWTVDSSEYSKVMSHAKTEDERDYAHTRWVGKTLRSIEDRINLLKAEVPRDYQKIRRFYAKYHQMDDEEFIRRTMKEW